MSWLTFNSTGNTIAANGTNTLNITVNTATLLEPCNYVGKIWITGNGTTTQWGLVVSVKTRYVVIDGAFGSSLAPDRCDVGSTQNFSYHVIWAHDSSDAVNGKLNITNAGQKFRDVNGTGWVPWQNTSNVSSNVTFPVTNVSFIYKDPTNGKNYTITNFTMKAPILNTIWDRVNITIKIPYSRIDVCTDANPVVKAVYETDGLNFTGNVTLSPTRYCDVSPNNRTGERVSGIPDYITAIGIIDPQYHLKAFNSSVVACVWDRIRILGGGVSSPNVNVGENGTFWVIVIYEWDNRMFKGSYPSSVRMGQAYVDVYDGDNKKVLEGARMNWSSERDRWEYSVAFDSPGTRTFVVSGVDDYQYNLTKTKDSVGPLSITWGQSSWWNLWTIQPSQTSPVQTTSANGSSVITWPQNPFGSAEAASQVWIIVVAVVLVSCISAIILWVLGIKRNRRKRRSRV
jgi:hypothetical protein